MRPRIRFVHTAVLLVAVSALPASAFAGPPLLCHPYDIGAAKSLPWDGGGWAAARSDYPLARLADDTQALLTPTTPVIVRMETLRRASIYASRDPRVASDLVRALVARTRTPQGDRRSAVTDPSGAPDALALLDAAYLTGALAEIVRIGGIEPFRGNVEALKRISVDVDSWKLMTASLAARPGDANLEFAAALVATAANPAAYAAHAQRARQGAAADALLARNLSHLS
jgi:hypothetical protein